MPLHRAELLRLLRFLVVGAVVTAVSTAMFVVIVRTTAVGTILASIISYILAILLSWTLQRRITFRDLECSRGAFIKFICVSLAGMVLTALGNHILHDVVGCRDIISSLVTAIPVAAITFIIQRLWTFKSKVA